MIPSIGEQIFRLEKALERHACGNIAPIPIAIALEEEQWTVDIHVRESVACDYEISATSPSLATALQNVRRQLGHEADNRANAAKDAAHFGLGKSNPTRKEGAHP